MFYNYSYINMESLRNYTSKAKGLLKNLMMTASLASVLTFSASSCEESRSSSDIQCQINSYIISRDYLVQKYKELEAVPKTSSNEPSIKKLEEKLLRNIKCYDREIERLAGKKIDVEIEENEIKNNMGCCGNKNLDKNEYPDEKKYEYLKGVGI